MLRKMEDLKKRIEDLETKVGIKDPLQILSVSFIDSDGRRCNACQQHKAFLSGLEKDASGIKVFVPVCEGCQELSKGYSSSQNEGYN